MAHDLSAKDVERATFAFSIYDFEGNDTMDAYYIGDCLRALNLNPTLAQIEKVGGLKTRKQKFLKLDEFLPIFSGVKNNKDAGGFDDFMECMRLYDKRGDGHCLFAEMRHILLSLGERLEEKEIDGVLTETCPEEDEEGWIPYEPFLKKLLAGPQLEKKE